jgi:hypothetical protein
LRKREEIGHGEGEIINFGMTWLEKPYPGPLRCGEGFDRLGRGDNWPPSTYLYGIFLKTSSFEWKGYSYDSFRGGYEDGNGGSTKSHVVANPSVSPLEKGRGNEGTDRIEWYQNGQGTKVKRHQGAVLKKSG